MEKIIAVVFDSEDKAFEAVRAFKRMDQDGTIAVHSGAVVRRNEEGKVDVLQKGEFSEFPLKTFGGTAIGSLIGLLGGPGGVLIGAGAGALVGFIGDVYRANVDLEFIGELAETLAPGKVALVVDANEEWITPVDVEMEEIGGIVIRRARIEMEEQINARTIEGMNKEIAQLEREREQVKEERRLRLESRIDELKDRAHAAMARYERVREAHKENRSKMRALKEKVHKSTERSKQGIKRYFHEVYEADVDLTKRVQSSIGRGLKRVGEDMINRTHH